MSDKENEVMLDGLDDGPILPEGWTEDMDIFADDEPSVLADDATDTTPAEETEAPTTGQPASEAEDAAAGEEAPTTEPETQEAPVNKLRFKAKVDHNDVDVELDEADLPTIYQKAQATDRAQSKLGSYSKTVDVADKLAAAMGYGGRDEMLQAAAENYRQSLLQDLLDSGTPERIAEDYVNRQLGDLMGLLREQPGTPAPDPVDPAPAQPMSGQRDYTAEAGELLRVRPNLRGKDLPEEVTRDAVENGKPLVTAYLDYEARQNNAELERLRKENQIYKQNAEAAARAPVAGTSGGGSTNQKAEDLFLVGFNDDYY